ncbi:MAG: class I SAM-dependent methyltransferase [Chromatiales bacterium]|nr:class I SAM-dependent methyltransferase [Chromatiales bacterium]
MGGDGTREWLTTGAGRRLLHAESQQLAAALDSVFGDQLVQIGSWGPPGLFTRHARTRRAAVVARHAAPGVDLVTDLESLAIASDSVDAVLLPHVLERTDNPHRLLREVDRILRPDGQVLVLGFNPLGLWGLRRLLSRGRFPPGLVDHLITEHRLRDWLKLLSFAPQEASFCHFAAPLSRRASPSGTATDGSAAATGPEPGTVAPESRPPVGRLRTLGRRFARRLRHQSVFAACYLLVAHKETIRMTPIRLSFKRRRKLVGGLVNPTTRNAA